MLSIKPPTQLGISSSSSHSNNPFVPASRSHALPISCSLGFKKIALEPLRYQFSSDNSLQDSANSTTEEQQPKGPVGDQETRGREEKGISGIHVPRQRYISVPKAELLDALLSMFESKEDADEFLHLTVCLDSILHAEHKGMLEEMRIYYSLNDIKDQRGNSDGIPVTSEEAISNGQHLSSEDSIGVEDKGINCHRNDEVDKLLYVKNSFNLRNLFGLFPGIAFTNSVVDSRVAVATNFQHSFMKLLRDAEFEELSAQDLLLTYALNNDYLLTLPVYVDWKRASESKAIIFRRGYTSERQKGLLLVEKLDYLQSKLLQEIFFSLSRPLKKIGCWFNEVLKSSSEAQELQIGIEKVKLWLKEQYSPENTWSASTYYKQLESDQITDNDLPIWLAAQRAVPLYEGFLSSVGPRGRLIRQLLTWMGIIPSMPEASINPDNKTKYSETNSRPNFLPRITLSSIWKPATKESCGNNVWKMFKTSVSILFSRSTLQEPAFQELILLYTVDRSQTEAKDEAMCPSLQLKIYERIPIPDLPVIFPHKKLSFRILDTVRLDVASILGLLAYFVNYKFENIISSPSAVFLDVVAISALIIYISRVVLGYKQTWDRYQLLVNRTLYEKTLASGFGSVYFLVDASEQQQYKEAILAYALLLHSKKYQVSCRRSISDACERFLYDKFNEKIEMPVDKAMSTLMRLDLVREFPLEGHLKLKAQPCSKACETLKKRWDGLLGKKT